MKVRVPPPFGVPSAAAGIARISVAASRSASRFPKLIYSSRRFVSWRLLVEPEPCQILIDEMGRGRLEALQIRPVRHDPVPPQRPDLMRLLVEHVGLEASHQFALLCRIGLVQHLFVE